MPTKITKDEPLPLYQHKRKPPCLDRDHNPPSYLMVPSGHTATHICPSCGTITTIQGSTMRIVGY